MIVPNIESNIKGVSCFFSNKNILAYHMVYDANGRIEVVVHGNFEVGTKKNLFSATETSEILAESVAQGLYLDETTQIEDELKSIFGL
jgi:hypothetical protein